MFNVFGYVRSLLVSSPLRATFQTASVMLLLSIPAVVNAQYSTLLVDSSAGSGLASMGGNDENDAGVSMFTSLGEAMGIWLNGTEAQTPIGFANDLGFTLQIPSLTGGASPIGEIGGTFLIEGFTKIKITGPPSTGNYNVTVTVTNSAYRIVSAGSGADGASATLSMIANLVGGPANVSASGVDGYDDDSAFDSLVQERTVELNAQGVGYIYLELDMEGSFHAEGTTISPNYGGAGFFLEAEMNSYITKIVGPHGTVNF